MGAAFIAAQDMASRRAMACACAEIDYSYELNPAAEQNEQREKRLMETKHQNGYSLWAEVLPGSRWHGIREETCP